MKRLRLAPFVLAALLCACGGPETADPGGLTPGESQALNDAAAVLDANAIELNAVTDPSNEAAPK